MKKEKYDNLRGHDTFAKIQQPKMQDSLISLKNNKITHKILQALKDTKKLNFDRYHFTKYP